MIAYHYTSVAHLALIRRAGEISLATEWIEARERPAAWFTTRETYEPTAYKRVAQHGTVRPGGYLDLFEFGGGAARLAVVTDALLPYRAWREQSGVSSRMARALESYATSVGSDPRNEWWVSFRPVPWARVERVDVQREPHDEWATEGIA